MFGRVVFSIGDRDRTSHHKRTKQRGKEEQCVRDSWTCEEVLDGKGPWRQAGEFRRPKEEMEAAKAERRRYEEANHRSRHEKQLPKNCLGGAQGECGRVRIQT